MSTLPVPSGEDEEEFLLSCRFGDLDDVQEFIKKYGSASLSNIRDANGNTILHMASGNGHIDVIDILLPLVPPTLLSAQNDARSTALHWATLNQHLSIVQKLVNCPGGSGIDLIDIRNSAGISPLGEAERIGWDEGAKWLVEMMKLDTDQVKEVDENETIDSAQDVEIEIEDADGEVAKMTIGGGAAGNERHD